MEEADSFEQKTENDAEIVVIGITGNIGSGKSAVSRILREAGHTVYSSDETAKQLMNEDTELKAQITKNFGLVYAPDGMLDTAALARLVFGDAPEHHARLALLNRLVHPRVLEAHQQQIDEAERTGKSLVFVESALLYEVGLDDAFDYIIVVDAPEETRLQRAMQRDGVSAESIRARMHEQLPAQEKTKYADFVLDNSSTLDSLQNAIRSLLPVLEILPPRREDETAEELE